MSLSLLPKWMTPSVTDISPAFLEAQGIRLLMLDFDNTIVPYTTNVPTADMKIWLQCMVRVGVKLCVVSNTHKRRPVDFCKKYGIPCITHAKKPGGKGIREYLELFDLEPQQCALAGDQIFTDTLGANLAGVKSILVKPINNHNFWLKARHVLELPFIFAARNRRIEK